MRYYIILNDCYLAIYLVYPVIYNMEYILWKCAREHIHLQVDSRQVSVYDKSTIVITMR